MPNFEQYKKLQKYYLGSAVSPAEYKKGVLIMVGDFDSLGSCQSGSIPIEYWVYPKGETKLYSIKSSNFTFTLDHSDADYDYYVISGSGGYLYFEQVNIISGAVLNTSNVTTMQNMFNNCSSLTSLDVSSWDTSKVTVMYGLFSRCTSLTSLDLSSFNTSSVTDMGNMFKGCSLLTSVNVSSFNTNNVTTMQTMFDGCSSITSLDLSNFDTGSVTSMYSMFNNCTSLETLDLSGWDMSAVTSMSSMFRNCDALRTIYMRGCSSDTIADIESVLTDAGIRNNVTIVTE